MPVRIRPLPPTAGSSRAAMTGSSTPNILPQEVRSVIAAYGLMSVIPALICAFLGLLRLAGLTVARLDRSNNEVVADGRLAPDTGWSGPGPATGHPLIKHQTDYG